MQRIFLETTIQIQRLLYTPSIRQEIQKTILPYETLTSTYVLMEVQRTIGQDYRYLIELLLKRKPTTVSQWMHYLGEGKNLYSSRRLGRMIQIVAQILDQLKELIIDPVEVAYLLKQRQRWLLEHELFEGIDQVLDTTMCDLVRPNYTVPAGGRISCRRENARCNLPSLLNTHLDSIQLLKDNSVIQSALEAKTLRALEDIVPDTNVAKGERNCWSMGDLIIVLECPPDAALWTTNLKHFEPLCKALGRTLFENSSNV